MKLEITPKTIVAIVSLTVSRSNITTQYPPITKRIIMIKYFILVSIFKLNIDFAN